jgi:hypothetical protein
MTSVVRHESKFFELFRARQPQQRVGQCLRRRFDTPGSQVVTRTLMVRCFFLAGGWMIAVPALHGQRYQSRSFTSEAKVSFGNSSRCAE